MYCFWCMSFLPLSTLAAAYFYKHAGELERRQEDQDEMSLIWAVVGRLTGAWLVALVAFFCSLLLCDRQAVRVTFYATLTGRQFLIRLYKAADTDEE